MSEPTYYTKLLAGELEKRGVRLKLEYYDGNKSVDIFIPSVKLDIEVDGSHHVTDSNQALSDLIRTKYSLKKGRTTIRIANTAIYKNISGVADNILEIIEDLKYKIKKDNIEGLIKRGETNQTKSHPNVFNYSNIGRNHNETKDKSKRKKIKSERRIVAEREEELYKPILRRSWKINKMAITLFVIGIFLFFYLYSSRNNLQSDIYEKINVRMTGYEFYSMIQRETGLFAPPTINTEITLNDNGYIVKVFLNAPLHIQESENKFTINPSTNVVKVELYKNNKLIRWKN